MNNMIELPLFATPIKTYNINISDYKSYVHNVDMGRVENGWLSNNRNIITTDDNFVMLKNELSVIIDDYAYNFCGIKNRDDGGFVFTTSWVVRHDPNDWAHQHYHKNSLFSGCIYFDVPENSGDLVFHKDPTHQNFMTSTLTLDIDTFNIFNSVGWTINVEEGLVILFPSQIQHSVNTNMSNQQRYCLVFNVWYKGKIGSKEGEIVI